METVLIKKLLTFLLLPLLFTGCIRSSDDPQLKYHEDGRKKPKVAFFELRDTSGAELPWNLSQELTTELADRIKKIDKLYYIQEDDISWQYPIQPEKLTPFRDDNWLKENPPNVEFVVFTELLEHDILPRDPTLDPQKKQAYNLSMSVRLKVVDLRADVPKVVLQEIVSASQYIPSQLATIDYGKTQWGKTLYSVTPVGLAHSKIVKAVTKRVEDYVLLARSR